MSSLSVLATGDEHPVLITPTRFARLQNLRVQTVHGWIGAGRLNGVLFKRGRRVLIWRDRALDIIFNRKDWS